MKEFINVWALGGSASLSLTTKDGQATVEFNCTLGNPGAPHCLPTSLPSSSPLRQPSHRGPSEKERNGQRAALDQPEQVQEQQEVLLDTSVSNTVMAEDAETETLNKEIYTEVIPQLDGSAEPGFSDQLPIICDYCDYKNI